MARGLLLDMHGAVCFECRKQFPKYQLTNDHIVPKVLGGTTSLRNQQMLCRKCHTKKCQEEIHIIQKKKFIMIVPSSGVEPVPA